MMTETEMTDVTFFQGESREEYTIPRSLFDAVFMMKYLGETQDGAGRQDTASPESGEIRL